MDRPMNLPYQALVASDADRSELLIDCLAGAGWAPHRWDPGSEAPEHVALVVTQAAHASRQAASRDVIRITIAPEAQSADLVLSGNETPAQLTTLFADWLPPGPEQLDRMAAAFGRAAMLPLIESLRDELRQSQAALDAGAPCDAHKLAGLTGTAGFSAASEAWRQLDAQAGATDDARRTTRTAIVAINRWLAG